MTTWLDNKQGIEDKQREDDHDGQSMTSWINYDQMDRQQTGGIEDKQGEDDQMDRV